jgi:hypothetical protein
MRWLLAARLVLAVSLAQAAPPAIDPDTGTLVPTRITAMLDGAHATSATIRATFRLDVTGPATEHENQLSIPVPQGSVITGAVVRSKDHVQRLALERVGTVDEKFAALAARPGREGHRTWAIRVDAANGQATVGIAAPRDETLTLDVSFEAATCFVDDVRHVAVPEAWLAAIPQGLVPARAREELDEVCSVGGGGGWIALASRELGKRPAGAERVGVTAGKLTLAKMDIARLEIALAAELTAIPRDLHTAIVVDHSRSLTPAQRENQRAIVEAYLRAAPNSRVQVIGYARTAEPLLPGWMLASRAATRVDRAIRALPPRNGSNLDDALAAAHAWLASTHGTRRVLVFTDERLVPRINDDPLALQPLLPDHTLVHVVDVSGGNGTLTRTDDAVLAPFALATGGMAVTGGPDDNGDIDAMPLARPTSIDNLAITGAGWQEKPQRDTRPCALGFASALAEGQSCVWWGDGTQASGDVTITGALWGTTITKIVQPDVRGGRGVARILSTLSDLDSEIMQEVETAAAAANSVWSLFAMWGPRGGYGDAEGFGSFGTSGSCCSTSSVHDIGIGVGTVAMMPDRELQRQLAGAVARCAPRAQVTVVVETTLDEIASVKVDAADHDRAIEDCITDGVWDTFVSLVMPPPYARTKLVFQPS